MAFDFEVFRKQYDALAKQHALPSFAIMNNDFELEKISQESTTISRVVRKTMMEKVFNILTFLDMLLNPVNAPRAYIPYIKTMTLEDRKTIDALYGIFGTLTLRALPLEVEYSEKREAAMIQEIYKNWHDSRDMLGKLMGQIAAPVNGSVKKERSYYG